jgi:TP901 family phage tail tape measure protein
LAHKLIVEVIGDSSSLEAALGRSAAASTGFVGKLKASSAELSAVGASLTRHLTLPIAAIGAAGTKMAVDFQASMELLHTQAGIAQSSIANLSKGVLALAGPTATAPDVLAAGLYHLSSQGLRGAQSLHALQVAAEGAKMGGANLEDVTNALGAVLASKIAGVHSYEQAMGELNATVGAGDMRMQDLADAMGTGLPAKAAVAGVSLKDVSAALATFGDNNIRGAEAGTLLNSTMRLMEGPSKAAAKAMGEIGLNAADLGNTLRNQGIVAALELLKSKLDALPKEQQVLALTRMFGGRQSGGVQILIDQLGRLKQKEQEVAAGGNSFASDWGAYTQTAAYKMDQLGASMRAAGISIGDILLPFVSKAADALSSLAGKFQALPGPVKDFAVGAAATVAVIGPMLSTVGTLGTALAFLAANPIVLAVAALAALGAAMAAAVLAPQRLQAALEGMGLSAQTSGRIVADLQDAFHLVQQGADVLVGVIRSNWGTISNIIRGAEQIVMGVVNVLEAGWREFGSNIVTQATLAWNLVKATIQNALRVIEGVVNVFAGILHGNWSQVWTGIKEIVSGAWNQIGAELRYEVGTIENLASAIGKGLLAGIKAGADAVLSLLEALPGKIVAALGSLGSLLLNAGVQLMEGLARGIEQGAASVLGKVKHLGSEIVGAAKSVFGIFSPSRVFAEIGTQLMQGLAVGVDTGSPQAVSSLKKTLEKAQAAIDGARGSIIAAANHLGVAATQAVVAGVVGVQPTMTEQIKTALTQAVQQAAQAAQQALQTVQSNFSTLANSILSAFDAKHANYVAPAQKLLDKMQLQDQITQYQQAVDQAKTTLANDQDALTQALAGGDPATIKAAQAQVLSDQQAFTAALRQQQEFHYQQLAIQQTKAHAAEVAKERESLAQRLGVIGKELTKEPGLWDKAQKQVMKLLHTYEVPLYQSGQKFASQFADGIKSQLAAVDSAAKQMAEAVAKYVPRSPAKTGPLAFSSQAMGAKFGREFATGISQGLYNGQGLSSIAGAVSSVGRALGSSTPAGAPRSSSLAASNAGGGNVYNFAFPNYIGDRGELSSWLTQELTRRFRSGYGVLNG